MANAGFFFDTLFGGEEQRDETKINRLSGGSSRSKDSPARSSSGSDANEELPPLVLCAQNYTDIYGEAERGAGCVMSSHQRFSTFLEKYTVSQFCDFQVVCLFKFCSLLLFRFCVLPPRLYFMKPRLGSAYAQG